MSYSTKTCKKEVIKMSYSDEVAAMAPAAVACALVKAYGKTSTLAALDEIIEDDGFADDRGPYEWIKDIRACAI